MITKGAKPVALLVTSQFNQTVREYNGTTGAFVKVAASGGALGDPLGLVIGLDGNPLVSDGQTSDQPLIGPSLPGFAARDSAGARSTRILFHFTRTA